FSLGNSVGNPSIDEDLNRMQINPLLATAEVYYANLWFINTTARNDWSSTLRKDHRSYFYPSISTSLILTDLNDKSDGKSPHWLNLAKLRESHAETGSSIDPYQIPNTHSIGKEPNGNIRAHKQGTLYKPR